MEFNVGVFGEVNYKVLDQRQPELRTFGFLPGSAGNFYTGDFDLLLTSRTNDKTSVLSEIVFGEGAAQSLNVDLERLLLRYDYNDHLKMSFGRYHTGIGYYNTAFHSGKWLHNTADRPLIMEFATDGGLLPTQAIGVSVNVRPDTDGSGRFDDENNGNNVNVGLYTRPPAIPGLQLGASFYHDKISNDEPLLTARLNQSIANVHAIYTGHGLELLNEGLLIRHETEDGAESFNTPPFYSQISQGFGHIRRSSDFQYVNVSARGFCEDVGLRYGPSFSARYDFNDNVAFKLQLDHTVRKGKPDLNGLQTQLAFTF